MNEKTQIISGNLNKFKNWVNTRIRIPLQNTLVGVDAGKAATGNYNAFVGYRAGYAITTSEYNNFIGCEAGGSTTIGHSNNFMGHRAGFNNISGKENNFMGRNAGYLNETGHYNNAMGFYAGYSNAAGDANNFIGYKAGVWETGSNKLFIDNAARANEADGRIKALIYGVFAAATANQLLRVNGILELTEISDYANNAAAITGGLTTGQLYRNGDSLNIVH